MMPQFTDAFKGDEHNPFMLVGGRHAMLLVHGFPGSPAEMRPLAQHLHQLGWTVQGVLLPGFGAQIETLPERKADDWVREVERHLRALQQDYDTVVLVGLSMGGAISIQVAATCKPDALILFAPFWRIEHILWRALPLLKFVIPTFKPFRLFKPDFEDVNTQASMRNFMPDVNLQDSEVQKAILDLQVPVGMIDQIRIVGQQGFDYATQIDMPTLVVQGDVDELVQPDITRQLIARFCGPVQYTEVPDGHELVKPYAKAWPQIHKTLDDFLQTYTLGDN